MPTDLPHLAASVFNTPLLVNAGKLDTILSAIGPRILAGVDVRSDQNSGRSASHRRMSVKGSARQFSSGAYVLANGIAVLPVLGTLIRRGSWLDSLSGMTSYGAIADGVAEALADRQVRGLMMEYDTPGGEAGGVFDLANFIRKASAECGKPVWAHANELAASAGYALASAADRIWLSTTGEVGSIGVVAAHIDMSKADEQAGLKWTYVYAGDRKVEGNAHEPLGKQAKSAIQADVDGLYSMFTELVASNRSMSAEQVRSTQARVYRGSQALKANLADNVGTIGAAVQALSDTLEANLSSGPSPRTSRRVHTQLAQLVHHPSMQPISATPPPAASEQSLSHWRRAFSSRNRKPQ